ncbi:MAG: BMP family ABC transporter substrate-binding protein, partial [Clostridia bacterium]|nr:BMP family ABC transporter substrate-binding protein [Clostridia bacterium]
MKKFVALLLVLTLCLSAFVFTASAEVADVKLGVILLHDENSTYDMNFINGVKDAAAALGLSEDQIIMKRNIPESQECTDA